MRAAAFAFCCIAISCATAPPATETRLAAADSATQLIASAGATMRLTTRAARNDDPLTLMDLTLADGRVLHFEEANHAPMDLAAQAAAGPLAQVMGLDESATPTLYRARDVSRAGAFCGPAGPHLIGVHTGTDGLVSMVGLKEDFSFDTRADGGFTAQPVGPAIVCARLKFLRAG